MAYRKIEKAVQALGYCCPWAYFYNAKQVRKLDTLPISKELKMSVRSVRYLANDFAEGFLTCQKDQNVPCLKATPAAIPAPVLPPALTDEAD